MRVCVCEHVRVSENLHKGKEISEDIEQGGELRGHGIEFRELLLENERRHEQCRGADEERCLRRVGWRDADVWILTCMHRLHMLALVIAYIGEGIVQRRYHRSARARRHRCLKFIKVIKVRALIVRTCDAWCRELSQELFILVHKLPICVDRVSLKQLREIIRGGGTKSPKQHQYPIVRNRGMLRHEARAPLQVAAE